MGEANSQLSDALKRLSAAKYGKPRSVVEKEIFTRLKPPTPTPQYSDNMLSTANGSNAASGSRSIGNSGGSSFLDEWLAKRKQQGASSHTKPLNSPATSASLKEPSYKPSGLAGNDKGQFDVSSTNALEIKAEATQQYSSSNQQIDLRNGSSDDEQVLKLR